MQKMKVKDLTLWCFIVLLTFLLVGLVSATTRTVCKSGCDYSTIQSAVDASSSGDTVYVRNGTYIENVKITEDTLTLRGENRDATIIDGAWYDNVVEIDGDSISVTGFTIRNSGSGDAGVSIGLNWCFINCGNKQNRISGNKVINNGVGIETGSDHTVITENNISSNVFGLKLWSDNNTIRNNYILSNEYHGILLSGSNKNKINNNAISSNGWGKYSYLLDSSGIHISSQSGYNAITNNTIKSNNKYGIYFEDGSSYNSIYNNNFVNNPTQAYEDKSFNYWDNGKIVGGNYWSDYSSTGNPSNGNNPYIINANSQDKYPFQDMSGWLITAIPTTTPTTTTSTSTTTTTTISTTTTTLLPSPSGFWGNAYLNGNPAPVGAVVSAFIGSTECGGYTIETPGIYGLVVVPNTTTLGCGTEGAIVIFKINGNVATSTGTWHSDTNQYIDIYASTSPTTTTSTTVTTTTTTTTTTTIPLSLSVTRILPSTAQPNSNLTISLSLVILNESNKPNSVIIKDYAPTGWNLTSSNPSRDDFNSGTGEIRWLLYSTALYTRNLTYTIFIPSNATGTIEFSGVLLYTLEENLITLNVSGNKSIQISYKADKNDDGKIDDFELLDYINLWVQGRVDDFSLLIAIDKWAKG